MKGFHELTKEVNRIVTAPDSADLKRLTLVLASTSDCALLQWALSKVCQLAPLADVVRGAAPGLSAPIVTKLALVDGFRAHLVQYPAYFEHLLRDAGENLRDGTRAASWDASVVLLSHTLPETVALPESACHSIEQMVEDVIEAPSVERLCRIYDVVSSHSIHVFDDLPADALTGLISTCRGVLPIKADTLRNLLCLGLFAMAAEPRGSKSCSSRLSVPSYTPTPSIVSRHWREAARILFRDKKGYKIVSLTVLGVTVLCSDCDTSSATLRNVLSAMYGATSVLNAIQPALCKDWLSKNMEVLHRLESKLKNGALDSAVRRAGLRFYCTLLGENCETILARDLLDQFVGHEASLAYSEDIMTMLFNCVRSTPTCIHKILGYAIDQCFPGRFEGVKVTKIKVATLLIEALRKSTDESSCQQVIAHICQKGLPDWWNLDLHPENAEENCGMLDHCPKTFQKTQYELKTAVSLLLIEKSCLGTTKLPLDPLTTVIHQVQDSKAARSSWSCSYPCRLAPLVEPNARRHDQMANANVKWQVNLANDLQAAASRSYDLILRRVDDICCDFETRCNQVEEPLRAAGAQAKRFKEESDIVHLELESCRQRILDLETALEKERRLGFAIEQKSSGLENELATAVAIEAMLKRNLNEAEQALQQHEDESEITIQGLKSASKETLKDALSDHRTVVLGLQAELEVERDNSTKVAKAAEEVQEDMQRLMHEVSESHRVDAQYAAQLHQTKLENIQSEKNGLLSTIRGKDATIEHLRAASTDNVEQIRARDRELVELRKLKDNGLLGQAKLQKELKNARAFRNRVLATVNQQATSIESQAPSPLREYSFRSSNGPRSPENDDENEDKTLDEEF